MKSIAILGGTFDPIHNAHLELAHTLMHIFHFDQIMFIPCKQNLLKKHKPATSQERIDMIKLAIAPFQAYHCDTREINRDSASYTIETLQSLRADYPNDSLTFTMGLDSFNDLDQWHGFENFLDYVHLFIFPRPGYGLKIKPSVQKIINEAKTTEIKHLHDKKQGYIYFADQPNTRISSTDIRQSLSEKDLPAEVFDYIKTKNLYNYLGALKIQL